MQIHAVLMIISASLSLGVMAESPSSKTKIEKKTNSICHGYSGQALNLKGVKLQRESSIELSYDGYNNLEGPVWIDDALYYSNIGNRTDADTGQWLNNQTTIWRWQPGTKPEVWLTHSTAGTNGMAVDADGHLVVARHLDGSISRINTQDKSISLVADHYQGKRFNSPNDLVVASEGSVYFTDPDWNVPNTVDSSTLLGGAEQHIYHVSDDGQVTRTNATKLVPELMDKPNGITLSIDESKLYVAGRKGLWSFNTHNNTLSQPKQLMDSPIDGLGRDCAGNIYITTTKQIDDTYKQVISILNAADELVGDIEVPAIQIVTNVAFGGVDRKTLFVTSLTVPKNDAGTGPRRCGDTDCVPASIFSVKLNVPGYPY